MPSLLDIAPSSETVNVRGLEIEVTGVSAQGFASLLARFPELRKLMSGMDVEPDDLFRLAGNSVAPVIAAGTGSPDDPEAEAAAGRLSLSEQSDLLEAIFRQTFPRGVGPFVERLSALMEGKGGVGAAFTGAQATKSPKQSKP